MHYLLGIKSVFYLVMYYRKCKPLSLPLLVLHLMIISKDKQKYVADVISVAGLFQTLMYVFGFNLRQHIIFCYLINCSLLASKQSA
jgi:hypothetical protein